MDYHYYYIQEKKIIPKITSYRDEVKNEKEIKKFAPYYYYYI